MYELTQDDVELLARLAGGLNFNRRDAPPGERFPASVRTANADELNALVLRLTAPATGGGTVIDLPGLAYGTTQIDGGQPGVTYTAVATVGGRFSVEVSGSPLVTFAVGNHGVFDPARMAQGAGTATPLAVNAGEWCTWRYDAPQGGQTMRPQLLAP